MTRKLFIVRPTFTRKFLQGAKGSNPLSCPPWKNLVVNIFILKFMFTTRFFQGGDVMVLLPLVPWRNFLLNVVVTIKSYHIIYFRIDHSKREHSETNTWNSNGLNVFQILTKILIIVVIHNFTFSKIFSGDIRN